MTGEWEAVVDGSGRVIDRSYFWTEGCGTFALVLAEMLKAQGLEPRLTVASVKGGERWSDAIPFEVTHVLVKSRRGLFDVNGMATTEAQALTRVRMASDSDSTVLHGDYTAEEFAAIFMGDDEKPLYPPDEETSEWAKRLIMAAPERFGLDAVETA